MKKESLPTFEQCEEAVKKGEATALEIFIHENEPAGPQNTEKFREELANLISETVADTLKIHVTVKHVTDEIKKEATSTAFQGMVGQVKMWPESSQVYSTDYDVLEQRLIVVFKSNMKAYEYNHFPVEKYNELLKCESIGSFINKEVKGKFNYRAIEAEETIVSHPPINTPDL